MKHTDKWLHSGYDRYPIQNLYIVHDSYSAVTSWTCQATHNAPANVRLCLKFSIMVTWPCYLNML